MGKLTQPKLREIIEDFAKEINQKKRGEPKPPTTVINFRNELKEGFVRPIYYVPIELLRFRKHNGRISSDVMSYEKNVGPLDEISAESQEIIRGFLEKKDPEKTQELMQTILHVGQREPAIITCDGFLINGNRRKMVFEKLLKITHGEERFKTMKVVILPGKDDPGGPPTIVEIEELENRYQLQKEGKAEYYGFDRALSLRRKMDLGITLEQLLRDDPVFAGLPNKQFKKEVEDVKEKFIKPLECVDKYLCHLGREGLYNTVATGLGDPEGRWQAFVDYYGSVYCKLHDDKKRMKLGINEDEIGNIEDVAFKIIRMREIPGLPKVHKIMRDLPKWLSNSDSKEELLDLIKVDSTLSKSEFIDSSGKEKDHREQDKIWQQKHKEKFIARLKKADDYYSYGEEKETPMKLLDAALKKLNHENMDPQSIKVSDLKKAMRQAEEIAIRANQLKSDFYQLMKNSDAVLKKFEHKK